MYTHVCILFDIILIIKLAYSAPTHSD